MRVALRRLIQLVVVLVFVSFFSFSLISLVPGDPVVAIVGQQARTAIGAHYQQEVDLQSLFKDVAGDFVATACRRAL